MKRAALAVLLLVLLTASPAAGVIRAQLVADSSFPWFGGTVTVHLFVSDIGGPGINSVAVQISVVDLVTGLPAPGAVQAVAPVTFVPPLNVNGLPGCSGIVTPDGGLTQVAASVQVFPPLMGLGTDGPVEVLNFRVHTLSPRCIRLTLANYVGAGYMGIVNWSKEVGNPANYVGAQFMIIPEPASVALLALGGLLAVRRRR